MLAKENKLAYDSSMRIPLLLLLLLPFSLQADIYRSIDRDGNVTFTDEPNNKAELIELEELPTYEAAPIPVLPVEAMPEPVEEDNDLKSQSIKLVLRHPSRTKVFGPVAVF